MAGTKEKPKKVSIDIIYINYFNYKETLLSMVSLKELIKSIHLKANIFIFDNSFSLIKPEVIKQFEKKITNLGQQNFSVKYIPSYSNIGFGKGCNKASKFGDSEIILFLNCDTSFKNPV